MHVYGSKRNHAVGVQLHLVSGVQINYNITVTWTHGMP